MTARWTLPAFAGYGIELEYAIVDCRSLAVRPIAGKLLSAFAGHETSAVERGALGWSNELVRHVVELKNVAPVPALESLPPDFHREVVDANRALAPLNARLMPTGMHPWMNPREETLLWTADNADIYSTYDRIFNCRRHGWANIQSMHINLPFADAAQFARLHAAVRLVLPLLPALAASSPVAEGQPTGMMDYRLEAYRANARDLPSITGLVIPETVADPTEYQTRILPAMYREIAPHDPDGVLRHEWLNSRGAIPRFERSAIEIRLADTQECPQADVAIAAATTAVVKALYSERWASLWQQQAVGTGPLVEILLATMRDADQAIIDDAQVLDVLGIKARRCSVREAWQHILRACAPESRPDPASGALVDQILEHGPLARRIVRAIDGDYRHRHLHEVYGRLCECLADGVLFA